MSRVTLIGLLLILLKTTALAQTDSLPGVRPEFGRIKVARNELLDAFLRQDRPAAQYWLDSLDRLQNENYATTVWDERWLLYHWLGMYEVLFREVAEFDRQDPEESVGKAAPPADSLFEHVDEWMFEKRLELVDNIRQQLLNPEEKLFAILHLEYLLRMGIEGEERIEQDKKIQAFVKAYPNTRFRSFIQNYMYFGYWPAKHAFGLDLAFLNGNWTNELERNLSPLFAAQCSFSYWYRRLSLFGGITAGGVRLERPVYVRSFEWPMDEKANYVDLFVGAGLDIVDTRRLRITPEFSTGVAILRPPASDDPDAPLPAFYDEFVFSSLLLRAGLHTDLKFGKKRILEPYLRNDDYNGVRLSFGYQRLNFGRKTNDVAGNMLYFAVGISLNSRPMVFHKL